MNESPDVDFVSCSFCDSSVPVWGVDDNGECDTCRNMSHIEREALIADERLSRHEQRTRYTQ